MARFVDRWKIKSTTTISQEREPRQAPQRATDIRDISYANTRRCYAPATWASLAPFQLLHYTTRETPSASPTSSMQNNAHFRGKRRFSSNLNAPWGCPASHPKNNNNNRKNKRNKGRRRLNCLVISKPRREIETDEEEKKCRGRSGYKFVFFEVESNCARGITSTLSFK